ncbi:MAG: EF-Tu/IF-2/RF-3 family GTPase [Candidatus Micrarchaeota archaeon]
MSTKGVAVIDLQKQLALRLGKKGTATDYTIYNRRSDEETLCLYEPTLYPEKLVSLLHCLNSSDFALLVFDGISKEIGEAMVALDMLGIQGIVCFRDGTKEEFSVLARGTSLEKFQECAYDDAAILAALEAFPAPRTPDAPLRIPLDSSFLVKSVGVVALGIVKRGVVNVHDSLTLVPSGKKASVRSLQVQDKDVDHADAGDRVGLCLKDVNVDDLERGVELVKENSPITSGSELEVEAELSKFQKSGLTAGSSVLVSFGMQMSTANLPQALELGAKGKIKLEFLKPFAYEKGAAALLVDNTRPLRILGRARFL